MKKAFPVLGLLIVLAAIIAFTWRRAGGLGERFPASQAAELAPGNAMVFIHLPDLERARGRLAENEVNAIAKRWRWPEGAWLKMLIAGAPAIAGDSELCQLFLLMAETESVDPAGFFLAVTDFADEPLPKVVGGFPFRTKRTVVDSAVSGMKEKVFARWPGARSELSTHDGIEIETITSATPLAPPIAVTFNRPTPRSGSPWILRTGPGGPAMPSPGLPTIRVRPGTTPIRTGPVAVAPAAAPATKFAYPAIHLAFRDDWLFFATDRGLLAETLDRYLRKPGAAQSLALDPVFAECRKHAMEDADLVAWARWESAGRTMMERLLKLDLPLEANSGNPLLAVQYSCALRAPQSRDRLYFHLSKAPQSSPLSNRSIALTKPETHGYAALNFDALLGAGDWIREQVWSGEGSGRHDFMLGWTKAELDELRATFGPEVGVTIQGTINWPEMVIALEVRDAVKARRLAERIAAQQHASAPTIDGETTRWAWPSSPRHTFLSPMVLTKTHLLFATSREAAKGMVSQAESRGRTLQASRGYVAATAPLSDTPDGMVFYFNTPAYHLYARGALTRSLGWEFLRWQEDAMRNRTDLRLRTEVDPALGVKLQPGIISMRTAGPGWLVESTLGVVGNTIVLLWLRDP